MKPILLDLFCGAGGCSVGYGRSGFRVIGVDIVDQPHYPYEFHRANALDVAAELAAGATHFLDRDGITFEMIAHAIHASPPCQAFSVATLFHGRTDKHVDLVDPTRQALLATGLPWVIENVPGAPIRKDVLLCGEMFGLGVHRHRYFETHGFFVMQPPHSRHRLKGAPTNSAQPDGFARLVAGHFADLPGAREAMGINWMNASELAQAIPPAYTEHIGEFLLKAVTSNCVAGDEFEDAA